MTTTQCDHRARSVSQRSQRESRDSPPALCLAIDKSLGGPVAALTDRIVPLLPLPGGVVMPQMVVTIAAESAEAIAAAESAGETGELLLVTKLGERYAKVGVLARVESTGALPGGTRALVVRATTRARLGAGVVGTGPGLWIEAEPITETTPTDAALRLGTELRAT